MAEQWYIVRELPGGDMVAGTAYGAPVVFAAPELPEAIVKGMVKGGFPAHVLRLDTSEEFLCLPVYNSGMSNAARIIAAADFWKKLAANDPGKFDGREVEA